MRAQKKSVLGMVLVSLVMAILRTVIISVNMEKNVADNDTYYLPDSLEFYVYAVFTVILTVLIIFASIMLCKKSRLQLSPEQGMVPAASLILAFALIGSALFYTIAFAFKSMEFTVFEFLVFLFCVFSAINFIFSGLRFNANKENPARLSTLALVPLALSVFRLVSDFIASSAAPLASSGVYHLVGLIAVLLFFLFEGKSYVLPVSAAAYTCFGYISIYFLLIYSFPNLVMHCFGVFAFDYAATFSVIDLGLVVYISARLAGMRRVKTKAEIAEEYSEIEE